MFPSLSVTPMLTPSPGERHTDRPGKVILYFFAVFGIGSGRRALISLLAHLAVSDIPPATDMLIQLFATVFTVAAVILWCCRVERRSLMTLGFIRRGAMREYLIGIVAGVALFSAAVGLCLLAGVATLTKNPVTPSSWMLLLFLLAFLIQGLSEELLCRSFLMVSLSRRLSLWACAVINSALFSLLHLLNPGITPLALINIFLFGLLASLLVLRRGSIWMAAALHSLWNFVEGNLFGISVSGLGGIPSPLVTTVTTDRSWKTLIHGGDFGIEAGLASTVVFMIGILLVLLMPTTKFPNTRNGRADG